jgi:hypothetical protein
MSRYIGGVEFMPVTRDRNDAEILEDVGGLCRPARRSGRSDTPRLRVVEEASQELGDVLLSLNTSHDGLLKVTAADRRGQYGLNEVAHERAPRWYIQLLHSFHNPFIYLLTALAVVSFLTDDVKATVIIVVMVSISVGLRFVQEFRSTLAAERLQAMVGTTATVSRPGPRITGILPLGEEPHDRNAPRHRPTREEVPTWLTKQLFPDRAEEPARQGGARARGPDRIEAAHRPVSQV